MNYQTETDVEKLRARIAGLTQQRDFLLTSVRTARERVDGLGASSALSEHAYDELMSVLDDEPLEEDGERIRDPGLPVPTSVPKQSYDQRIGYVLRVEELVFGIHTALRPVTPREDWPEDSDAVAFDRILERVKLLVRQKLVGDKALEAALQARKDLRYETPCRTCGETPLASDPPPMEEGLCAWCACWYVMPGPKRDKARATPNPWARVEELENLLESARELNRAYERDGNKLLRMTRGEFDPAEGYTSLVKEVYEKLFLRGKTDSPTYEQGRASGRASVKDLFQKVVDPDFKRTLSLEAVLAEIQTAYDEYVGLRTVVETLQPSCAQCHHLLHDKNDVDRCLATGCGCGLHHQKSVTKYAEVRWAALHDALKGLKSPALMLLLRRQIDRCADRAREYCGDNRGVWSAVQQTDYVVDVGEP